MSSSTWQLFERRASSQRCFATTRRAVLTLSAADGGGAASFSNRLCARLTADLLCESSLVSSACDADRGGLESWLWCGRGHRYGPGQGYGRGDR